MFNRTETLGTVAYKGQRALIVAALTYPKFPKIFSQDQVVAAIDRDAYEKTFKHGKMTVTIPASVQFHLRELVKLGQLAETATAALPKAEMEGLVAGSMELLTEWQEWEPIGMPFFSQF